MTNDTTTIQISRTNNELLDDVGARMRSIHPELWGTRTPPRDQIVGYLAAEFLRTHPNGSR